MFEKIMRSIGFMLISNSLFFTQITAFAESDSTGAAVMTGIGGGVIGGVITACVLISKSRTKFKATKAEQYINSRLQLHSRNDVYLRTSTTKTKINNK